MAINMVHAGPLHAPYQAAGCMAGMGTVCLICQCEAARYGLGTVATLSGVTELASYAV